MSRFSDTGLIGLEAALDPGAAGDLLRRAFPETRADLEITGVHLMDVRYQHDGPCWLLYRLKLRPGRGRSIHQLVSARLLRTRSISELGASRRPSRRPWGVSVRSARTLAILSNSRTLRALVFIEPMRIPRPSRKRHAGIGEPAIIA